MRQHYFGTRPSGRADGGAMQSDLRAFEAALQAPQYEAAGETGVVGRADQLARDLAEIECATAALRKAEPELESWSETSPDSETWPDNGSEDPPAMRKPHPVWLFIGLLWLSTALVTAGAVAAIRMLTG
jgi:hypothetical protein